MVEIDPIIAGAKTQKDIISKINNVFKEEGIKETSKVADTIVRGKQLVKKKKKWQKATKYL